MGVKKYPIRLRQRATVAADGTGYVRTEVLQRIKTLTCQSVAFRNQTGVRGTVEIYIKEGGNLTFIVDQPSPPANEWYWYPYHQTLKQGEQLEAQQASCLTNDVLDLHIIGYATYANQEEE